MIIVRYRQCCKKNQSETLVQSADYFRAPFLGGKLFLDVFFEERYAVSIQAYVVNFNEEVFYV